MISNFDYVIQKGLSQSFSSENNYIFMFSTLTTLADQKQDNQDKPEIATPDEIGKYAVSLDLPALLSKTMETSRAGGTSLCQIKKSNYFDMDFLKKNYPGDKEEQTLAIRQRYMVFFYVLNAYLESLEDPGAYDGWHYGQGDPNLQKEITREFVHYLHNNQKFIRFVNDIGTKTENMTDPIAREKFSAECLNQILTCVDDFEIESDCLKKAQSKQEENNKLESEANWRRMGQMFLYAALPLALTIFFSLAFSGVFTDPAYSAYLAAALWVKIFLPTLCGLAALAWGALGYMTEQYRQDDSSLVRSAAPTGVVNQDAEHQSFYDRLQLSRLHASRTETTLQLYPKTFKTNPKNALRRNNLVHYLGLPR